MALSESEARTLRTRYRFCDANIERRDIVFAYPSSDFTGDPGSTADKLQQIHDHLKAATGRDPTAHYGGRCIVGYRHPDDEPGQKDCSPGWGRHWVNIPWGFLSQSDQPLECATHELAHPFVELLAAPERWTEGLCDFLRIGAFAIIGDAAEARRRERLYIEAFSHPNGEYFHDHYHGPAGRLLTSMRAVSLDPDVALDVRAFLDTYAKNELASDP